MPSTAEKVRFLSDPANYPERPARIDVRETHMAYVFLTGERALKLKKPVRYPFLDFSTIAARRRDCEDEVRLNRRLAPGIYEGLLALRRSGDGGLSFAPPGRIVDWLVEMRQLPEADLLESRLDMADLSEAEVVALAEWLATFYARAEPEREDGHLYPGHLETEMAQCRRILSRPEFGLAGRADPALELLTDRYRLVRPELLARIADGHIVEGHGDLRPEHVFLSSPPMVIDCLEFSRAMRLLDPYDEVNYLGLECEMAGAPWVGPLLIETLQAHYSSPPSPSLMSFYGAFRAILRARLCMAHLLDPTPRLPEKWPPLAIRYLERAIGMLNPRPPEDAVSIPRD